MAVYQAMTGNDPREVFRQVMEVQAAVMENEHPSDEQDLIDTILMARPPGAHLPVSHYLSKRSNSDTKEYLGEIGMRTILRTGEEPERIWVATEIVKKTLLAGTRWSDANIKLILRRVEGAVESKQRLNGQSLNGISFVADFLIPPEPKTSGTLEVKKGYRPNSSSPSRPIRRREPLSSEEKAARLERRIAIRLSQSHRWKWHAGLAVSHADTRA